MTTDGTTRIFIKSWAVKEQSPTIDEIMAA